MYDVNHHNPFGLGLIDVNEVRTCIVYILDDIIIFFYQWLYYIVCLMALCDVTGAHSLLYHSDVYLKELEIGIGVVIGYNSWWKIWKNLRANPRRAELGSQKSIS